MKKNYYNQLVKSLNTSFSYYVIFWSSFFFGLNFSSPFSFLSSEIFLSSGMSIFLSNFLLFLILSCFIFICAVYSAFRAHFIINEKLYLLGVVLVTLSCPLVYTTHHRSISSGLALKYILWPKYSFNFRDLDRVRRWCHENLGPEGERWCGLNFSFLFDRLGEGTCSIACRNRSDLMLLALSI